MNKRRSLELDLTVLGSLRAQYDAQQHRGGKKEFISDLVALGVAVRELQAANLSAPDQDLLLAARLVSKGKRELAENLIVVSTVNTPTDRMGNASNPVGEPVPNATFRAESTAEHPQLQTPRPPNQTATVTPTSVHAAGSFKFGQPR